MKIVIAVFLGGGLGSVIRYLIGRWMTQFNLGLPIGTLLANLIACLILGLTVLVFIKSPALDKLWYAFLVIGLCGGMSTFSTFSHETVQLLKSGSYFWAFLNVFLSVSMAMGILMILLREIKQ